MTDERMVWRVKEKEEWSRKEAVGLSDCRRLIEWRKGCYRTVRMSIRTG